MIIINRIARVILLLVIVVGVGLGCARSKNYKQEQDYYRSDTEFSSASTNKSASKTMKYGQPKKKLFVLPFMNDTPFSDDVIGVAAADEMLRILRSSGKAVIPGDLKSNDTSREFYSGEKVRLSPLLREGKKLGVSLIVIGKIKKIKYRQKGDEVGLFRQKKAIAASEVEIRMFDCVDGKEVLYDVKVSDTTNSQLDLFGKDDTGDEAKEVRQQLVGEAIKSTVRLLAADIGRALEKIGWEGRVAKISGGRVYINAGRASGLNLGDILKVMTPGEDVYDPLTGAYMGRSTGQPKGTLEVVDFMGGDAAVTAVHSGGGFFENDVVQLY